MERVKIKQQLNLSLYKLEAQPASNLRTMFLVISSFGKENMVSQNDLKTPGKYSEWWKCKIISRKVQKIYLRRKIDEKKHHDKDKQVYFEQNLN